MTDAEPRTIREIHIPRPHGVPGKVEYSRLSDGRVLAIHVHHWDGNWHFIRFEGMAATFLGWLEECWERTEPPT